MKNSRTRYVAQGGIIAALYVVLTMVATALGLSSGVIQVRFSEALCILPCFFPAAVPGLFLGCLLANVLSGCLLWDIIFGSLATLIGALGTLALKKHRFLACLPPIISNVVIVPLVLMYVYEVPDAWWFLVLTVGAGEVISVGILGELLYTAVKKVNKPE